MLTPTCPEGNSASRSTVCAGSPEATSSRRSLHILLVEDEASLRNVVLEFLRNQSFLVEAAAEGQEALQKFRAGNFDLVIADRSLPKLDGDRLVKLIKELVPREPVIQLTGLSPRQFSLEERPPGVDRLLGKPFRLSALLRTIEEVVAASDAPEPNAAPPQVASV